MLKTRKIVYFETSHNKITRYCFILQIDLGEKKEHVTTRAVAQIAGLPRKGAVQGSVVLSTHPFEKASPLPPPPRLSRKGALRTEYRFNAPFRDKRGGGGRF